MKFEVILTIVRQVLLSLGAIIVTKGWADAETLQQIVGGLMALVAVIWGIVSKSKDVVKVEAANTVLETAATPVSKVEIAQAAATIEAKK